MQQPLEHESTEPDNKKCKKCSHTINIITNNPPRCGYCSSSFTKDQYYSSINSDSTLIDSHISTNVTNLKEHIQHPRPNGYSN